MKIVNRTQFFELPPGTLFSNYEPCIFGPLCIKEETCHREDGSPFDFFMQEIAAAIECNGSGQFVEKLDESLEKGTSLPMEFDMRSRDGMFDQDQLFAVWDKEDVAKLIDRLKRCLA